NGRTAGHAAAPLRQAPELARGIVEEILIRILAACLLRAVCKPRTLVPPCLRPPPPPPPAAVSASATARLPVRAGLHPDFRSLTGGDVARKAFRIHSRKNKSPAGKKNKNAVYLHGSAFQTGMTLQVKDQE
ncbi:unnamed protein product, partial [Urochloa humidicola]